MSVSLKLDNKKFNQALTRLVSEVGPRKMLREINSQVGVLVKNAVMLTPPTGSSPMGESPSVQRQSGYDAIEKDIRGKFRPFPLKYRDPRVKKWITKNIKAGNYQECSNILNEIGWPNDGVIKELTPSILKKHRNRRGRVIQKGKPIMVHSKPSINRMIKKAQQKVGYAKSGWSRAVKKFKAKRIPSWATKLGGKGFARSKVLGTMGWEIVFGNKVYYAGKNHAAKLNIMGRALRASRKSILKKIEILLQKGYRKTGF